MTCVVDHFTALHASSLPLPVPLSTLVVPPVAVVPPLPKPLSVDSVPPDLAGWASSYLLVELGQAMDASVSSQLAEFQR